MKYTEEVKEIIYQNILNALHEGTKNYVTGESFTVNVDVILPAQIERITINTDIKA